MPVVIGILLFIVYLIFVGFAYLFEHPVVAFWIAVAIGVVLIRKRRAAERERIEAIAAEQRRRDSQIAEEKRRKETAERLRNDQLEHFHI